MEQAALRWAPPGGGGGAFGYRAQIQQLLSSHGRGPGGCPGGKGLRLSPPAPEQAL